MPLIPSVAAAPLPPQYGRLRPNGVILKTQKGRDSFAFIDFEEAAPAQVGFGKIMGVIQISPARERVCSWASIVGA